jgi:hypothetical protein
MDGSDFEELRDTFPTVIIWEENFPCACTLDTGYADRTCLICNGKGRYYGDPSEPFTITLTNMTARERAAIAQTMGPGMMGESKMHVFAGAPCYERVKAQDRVWDTAITESKWIVLQPGIVYKLPPLFTSLVAMTKQGNALVQVAPPLVSASRDVSTTTTTRLQFRCPRVFEVMLELPQIRTFGEGLPKIFGLRLADISLRS